MTKREIKPSSSSQWSSQSMFLPEPFTSQHSQSQQSQSQFQSNSQNKETIVSPGELANEVLLFFLNYHYQLKPIKKSTITKYFKNVGSTKVFNEVMKIVKYNLNDAMGLDIVENDEGKATEYYLVNSLTEKVNLNEVKLSNIKLEEHKLILLYIILTAINKSGNKLKEDALLQFLQQCCIIKDVKTPFAKGFYKGLDVEKFIRQELTGMSYLSCNEIDIEDEKTYEYRWGIRAENEFSLAKIDEFFDEVDALELNNKMMDVDADDEEDLDEVSD